MQIILLSLGSPQSRSPLAVAKFLRKFLGDPHVLRMPAVLRWILLHFLILPFYTLRATKKYRAVWDEKNHCSLQISRSRELAAELQKAFPQDEIRLAFLAGTPSIADVAKTVPANALAIPLFPQNADSSFGAVATEFQKFAPAGTQILPSIGGTDFYAAALAEHFLNFFQNHGNGDNPVAGVRLGNGDTLVAGTPHGNESSRLGNGDNLVADSKTSQKQILNPVPENRVPAETHVILSFHAVPANGPDASRYESECRRCAEFFSQFSAIPRSHIHVAFQSKFGPSRWLTPSTRSVVATLNSSPLTLNSSLYLLPAGFFCDCVETSGELSVLLTGTPIALVPALNSSAALPLARAILYFRGS